MKKDGKRNIGLIFGGLFALCDRISDVFRSGFIYRLLSSHDEDKEAYAASALADRAEKVSKGTRRLTGSVKKFTARQFERSAVLRLFSAFISGLINIQGRVVGAFGITWAAYVIVIQLIKRFALMEANISGADLTVGIVVFLASLPLLFTEKTVICMAEDSYLVSGFLKKVFGIHFEPFKRETNKKIGQSIAVILGILLGLLTYFVSPLNIVVASGGLLAIALVFSYPEGGVIVSVAIAPLTGVLEHPSIVLAVFVLLTALSYFLKVLRGKRVFKIGFAGFATYAFMTVIFLSGFAPGSADTMNNALLCCSLMMIFPLITNLMTNKHWINACAVAFIFPSALVGFIGLADYLLGNAPSGWVDESLYPYITQRTVSLFENPNMLGAYLAAMFPMALMLTLPKFNGKTRVLGVITSVYIAASALLTFSRSAWLALLLGAIIFAVMITPRGVLWLLPAALSVIAISLIFPDTVGVRLLNFFSEADSANNYRIEVWNSSWNLMCDTFMHGIGWGEEAFKTAYINYASDGTQFAMHSHSLYMQIVIQTGLIGLLVFLAAIFSIAKNCISATASQKSNPVALLYIKASLAGAFSIMIAGIFDYTWYNFRVFFIFWALLAFACSAVKVMSAETKVHDQPNDELYSYVTVAIPFSDRKRNASKANKEITK